MFHTLMKLDLLLCLLSRIRQWNMTELHFCSLQYIAAAFIPASQIEASFWFFINTRIIDIAAHY